MSPNNWQLRICGWAVPMTHSIRLWHETRSNGFESRPGRMFVIGVAHIQQKYDPLHAIYYYFFEIIVLLGLLA